MRTTKVDLTDTITNADKHKLIVGDITVISDEGVFRPVICIGADTICDSLGRLRPIPQEYEIINNPIPEEIEQAFLKVQQKYEDLREATVAYEKAKNGCKTTVGNLDVEFLRSKFKGCDTAVKAALREVQYVGGIYETKYSPAAVLSVAQYITKVLAQLQESRVQGSHKHTISINKAERVDDTHVCLTVGTQYYDISERNAQFVSRQHEETGRINSRKFAYSSNSTLFQDFVPVLLISPLLYKLEDGLLMYEKKNGVLKYSQTITVKVECDKDFEYFKEIADTLRKRSK